MAWTPPRWPTARSRCWGPRCGPRGESSSSDAKVLPRPPSTRRPCRGRSRSDRLHLVADSVNTGELIALALKRAGVRHLFTLNGGHIWPILTGAAEHGIRIIDVRHEQSAAVAAEGGAKGTRECGVAAVTAGARGTHSGTAPAPRLSAGTPT